jgi:adenosylhomocysteine nucleosidase
VTDFSTDDNKVEVVVLVCAYSEWKTVLTYYREPTVNGSPFGGYFNTILAGRQSVIFFSGWGKVAAAASTQYIIDTWQPKLLINLGTCGGFDGKIKTGEFILVDETLIYDIYERMSDPQVAIKSYSTHIDLSFLCEPFPQKVRMGKLVSADQDIDPDLIFKLREEYEAVAADWESGAIAWAAQRNRTRLLILRGVSDLVDERGGEVYGNNEFAQRAQQIMLPLLKALPNWVRCASWGSYVPESKSGG